VKIAKYQYKVAEKMDLETKFEETDPYTGEVPTSKKFFNRLTWLNNIAQMGAYAFISDLTGPISRLLNSLVNMLFRSPVLNYFLAGHFQDVKDRAVILAIKSFKRGMAYRDNAEKYDRMEFDYFKEQGFDAKVVSNPVPYTPSLYKRTRDIIKTYSPPKEKVVPFFRMEVKIKPKQKSYKDLPPLPGFDRGKLPPTFSAKKGVMYEFFLLGYWRAHEKRSRQYEEELKKNGLDGARIQFEDSKMSEADRNLVVDRVNLEIDSKLTLHFFKDTLFGLVTDPLYLRSIAVKTWKAVYGGLPRKTLWQKIKDGVKGALTAFLSYGITAIVKWKIGGAFVGFYAATSLFGYSGKALAFWLLGGIPFTYLATKAAYLFREFASKHILKDYDALLTLLAEEITDADVDVRQGLERIRALNRNKLVAERDRKRDQARFKAIIEKKEEGLKKKPVNLRDFTLRTMTTEEKREYNGLVGTQKEEYLQALMDKVHRELLNQKEFEESSLEEDYIEYRERVLNQKREVGMYVEEEIEKARGKYYGKLQRQLNKQLLKLEQLENSPKKLTSEVAKRRREKRIAQLKADIEETRNELLRFEREQTLPPSVVGKIWDKVKSSVGEVLPDALKPTELEDLIHKGDTVYEFKDTDRNS
jgi:hypothetical protein